MKRSNDRVPLKSTFRFRRVEDAEFPYVETSQVRGDVSLDGMFVPTKWFFPEGTVIELEFTLPRRGLPLQAVGRVVWSGHAAKGTGMGILFRQIDPRERLRLRRYAMAQ